MQNSSLCFEEEECTGDGLELESYYALKYIEKGMKGTLSYANSLLIFNLYMHNYILHS